MAVRRPRTGAGLPRRAIRAGSLRARHPAAGRGAGAGPVAARSVRSVARQPGDALRQFAIALMALPDTALGGSVARRAPAALPPGRGRPSAVDSLVTAPLHVDERRGQPHPGTRSPRQPAARVRAAGRSAGRHRLAAGRPSGRLRNRWSQHGRDPATSSRTCRTTRASTHRSWRTRRRSSWSAPDAASAAVLATAVADAFGLQLYRIAAASLPTDETQLDDLARLWRREAGLSPVALLMEDADDQPAGRRLRAPLRLCVLPPAPA